MLTERTGKSPSCQISANGIAIYTILLYLDVFWAFINASLHTLYYGGEHANFLYPFSSDFPGKILKSKMAAEVN
jgi:hypothetical protein